MEIEGYVGQLLYVKEYPDIQYIGVHYGLLNLRYIVLWTSIDSNQLKPVFDAYQKEYKVGMRYDQETKELLAIY